MDKQHSITLNVSVPVYAVLKGEAERLEVGVSALVRWAIGEYLEKLGVRVYEPQPNPLQARLVGVDGEASQ